MAISGYEGYKKHDVTKYRKRLKQLKIKLAIECLMFTLHISVIIFLLLDITLLLLIAYIK